MAHDDESIDAELPPKQKRSEILGDLWVIAGKLRGVGELFSMAMGEPPASEEG